MKVFVEGCFWEIRDSVCGDCCGDYLSYRPPGFDSYRKDFDFF